ncbi:hypothetical protein [Bosea sp. TAF32]|uniref:hypothetical protein n=1 Tax=Bosea sp. TAF32 TaxID=3237482 RepID=UPI003F9288DD
MLFSSLTDSDHLARAQAAFETAWVEIAPSIPVALEEPERSKLANIIVSLVAVAADEAELARLAVERYQSIIEEA